MSHTSSRTRIARLIRSSAVTFPRRSVTPDFRYPRRAVHSSADRSHSDELIANEAVLSSHGVGIDARNRSSVLDACQLSTAGACNSTVLNAAPA
jgi:hypothetical protein